MASIYSFNLSLTMNLPIIISAFGTTTNALATYTQLDKNIRNYFNHREIIWTYSSRKIAKNLQTNNESMVLVPQEALLQLARRGTTKAVLQSLHLFPGTEFHNLLHVARNSSIECAIGKPLLTSPQDYQLLSGILRSTISKRPEKAILILGHGTDHPIWTAYYSLEKILRRDYGNRIYVGVVEKYPDTGDLAEEIADQGFKQVCIIPLFLVTGFHYKRDIIGDDSSSWRSRLQQKKLEVETIDYGLGLYPGIEEIIINHILAASSSGSHREI